MPNNNPAPNSPSKKRTLIERLGSVEVGHPIREGESISLIAQRYMKQGWNVRHIGQATDAIWKLNSEVYSNLRDRNNPDLIYPGDVLIIPRTKEA